MKHFRYRVSGTGEDGMVGALASLFDQANVSLGVACREADALPEISFRDRMGTGAGHQKPFRLQQLHIREISSNREIHAHIARQVMKD